MIFLGGGGGGIVGYLVFWAKARTSWFKLTTELYKKVQYPHNQAIKNGFEWSNTTYLNKRSFIFKIKFRVFQATKT